MSNQKNISKIEQQVMAGVGTIYTMRVLTDRTALKVYAVILSLWGVGRLVWVSKVFDNFVAVESRGVSGVSSFVLTALQHTNVGVQAMLLVCLVAAASLAADAIRSMSTPQARLTF